MAAGFNDQFTAPALLDLSGSNYRSGRCLLRRREEEGNEDDAKGRERKSEGREYTK